jgi:hypothetical protein
MRGSGVEELILTCDETNERNAENELVCTTPIQKMGHSLEKLDNYKLKIMFPSEYNDETYSDLVDYINIDIKSWQITGEEASDTTAPVIELIGNNTITMSTGDTYTEQGATANDDVDGDITSDIITTGTVDTNTAGTYTITYSATDKTGNTSTVTRTVNVVAVDISGPDYIAGKGVNGPVLAQGMIPIKWNGSTWVDTTKYDWSWYNYDISSKQWANARTADGSMWVWIPRYAYKIPSSNYHTKTTGTIDIKFLMNTTNTTSDSTSIYDDNASSTHFVKHPAFTFGSTELAGIWVAKFETSGTSTALNSKPAATPYANISLKDMFNYTRNMEIRTRYGWGLASGTMNADGTFPTDNNGVDTHLIKNIEWGAVAYLTNSLYGKNASISNGGCTSGYTGCGSGTTYVTNASISSTTGTVHGIYDMAGGAYEYVMANYNNLTQSGPVASSLDNKYIDRYSTTNYGYDNSKWGDAIYETSATACTRGLNTGYCLKYAWYSSKSYMIYSDNAWLTRGGSNTYGDASFYYFSSSYGIGDNNISWHIVLLVNTGL